MKTETLLLLIGGGAALLWFMDKQNAAPAATAAPGGGPTPTPIVPIVANPIGIGPGQVIFTGSNTCDPGFHFVPQGNPRCQPDVPSPPHLTCTPPLVPSADGTTCVSPIQPPASPVFHPIQLRTQYGDGLLTPPVDPTQREQRKGTPGALSGYPIYGGWGR